MSSKKVIRTAVVGLGRIGWQYHIPEIISHDGFELIAAVDPLKERIDEFESKYNVKGYTDYEDMLKEQRPDLVVVCSPTKFHCSQSCMAFEFGADVFCEKPVVLNKSDMDYIIGSMKKNGRKFMVYQPRRGCSDILALKHIISQGTIGDVYMVKRSVADYVRRNDWQAFTANGGGMLYNYGSHFIDQLLCLADFKVANVRCLTRKIATLGDADDVVKFLFTTEKGVIMDLDINCASAFPMRSWHVLGQYGSAILDPDSEKWQVKYFIPEELQPLTTQSTLAAEDRQYCNSETITWRTKEYDLSDFEPIDYYKKCYDYFALDKEPFVTVLQSRQLVSIIEQGIASKDDF